MGIFSCLALLPLLAAGCAGSSERDDDNAVDEEEQAPLSFGLASEDRQMPINEPIQLAVVAKDPNVQRVRFSLDGKELDVCDAADKEDDCRLGNLFRFTTIFKEPGKHTIGATYEGPGGQVSASQVVDIVETLTPEPEISDVDTSEDALAAAAAGRGYLDPDKASHNIFGGVKWSVKGQKVVVGSPPGNATTAAKNCMAKYGASVRKWGDKYKISRGSIVATAITESNCTNPAGSSDGLSSGPMQVTASTCASITGLSKATCRTRMHSNPDFSFEVGVRYMASSYQVNQHKHDPPKIAAAYNAGSLRRSSANRWHMVVTGNHIERFVGGYNGYRAWEASVKAGALTADEPGAELAFDGEHVAKTSDLPRDAKDGQVYFVGDWFTRDGGFYEFHDGKWTASE
ncbi:lytic transglycosylase domain-containing protein [Pendulispora brunnea]|uniref:Lytic transglycosylase domain-containing protein n=1 Tax=Pendulispora brunnea TaxID=2905690 RepID=A0ABZ2K9E3_9BACT